MHHNFYNGRAYLARSNAATLLEKAASLYAGRHNALAITELCDSLTTQPLTLEERLFLLLALDTTQPGIIAGEKLAALVIKLFAAEITPGGPYKSEDGTVSPWLNVLTGVVVRRVGGLPLSLRHYLEQLDVKLTGNPRFDAALLRTCIADCLEKENSHNIKSLSSFQLNDGGWPIVAFTGEESRLITTALCLHYLKTESMHHTEQKPNHLLYTQLKANVLAECTVQKNPLRHNLHNAALKVFTADGTQEILLFPLLFHQSLTDAILYDEQLFGLCKANFYSWLAYTIYDDFLDAQATVSLLPIANFAQRKAWHLYHQAFPLQSSLIEEHYRMIDVANSREVGRYRASLSATHITFPALSPIKFETLAERSILHILVPRLIIENTPEQATVDKALTLYLAARQLMDDLHDWQDDFRRGHITFVVMQLVRFAEVKPGKAYNRDDLLQQLQRVYWQQTLVELTTLVVQKIQEARALLQSIGRIIAASPFEELLMQLEQKAQQALKKHESQKEFLTAYKKLL